MSTKLSTLHNQLATLRQMRQTVRLLTALAGIAIALLWVLIGIFLLDWSFSLPLIPRLIVMVIGATVSFWAFTRYTQPLLGVQETELEMALLVERQQGIDSDLVAALQFESSDARTWGSPQLESAVINYVADFGTGLNVFEGFSREQMVRRATILGVMLLVVAAFVLIAPRYAAVFFDRLLLGSAHYPSQTVIERVMLNDITTLNAATHGSTPQAFNGAQGEPLLFTVQCSGVLPETGTIRARAIAGSGKREIELKPLTNDQRLARLQTAHEMLTQAIDQAGVDIAGPWQRQLQASLVCDAPAAAALVEQLHENRDQLPATLELVKQRIESWPGEAHKSRVYVGDLGRLVDELSYSVVLGDAWTDPARVSMIPLPVVELAAQVTPPKYARVEQDAAPLNQRQLAVLEGSSVQFQLTSANDKPLKEAYLLAKTSGGATKYPFAPVGDDGRKWQLASANTPLAAITEEIRYEVQVTDRDGLNLDTPITGVIRLRPDRPPQGSAEVVHRVVLPTATPTIKYQVSDDYGVGQVQLKVAIQRASTGDGAAVSESGGNTVSDKQVEVVSFTLHGAEQPPLISSRPMPGSYSLALTPLKLAKGDSLKLTLEVTDYRGAAPGDSYTSEPLILDISDESGVLAAISEADERSEERLTDIIKKQLGIGESP